jgi:hypothetical protein
MAKAKPRIDPAETPLPKRVEAPSVLARQAAASTIEKNGKADVTEAGIMAAEIVRLAEELDAFNAGKPLPSKKKETVVRPKMGRH